MISAGIEPEKLRNEVNPILLRLGHGPQWGGKVSWQALSASHTEPEPHPLIDIISVETETHPLDTTGTGKVTNGSLIVHGYLKTLAEFIFPPDWSSYLASPPENALPLMISNYHIVGWLWLDVVFLRIRKASFHASDWRHIQEAFILLR
jgi:hypothetical protein